MPGSTPSSEPAASHQSPLAEVWSIAWPTVLTMTSYTVMQFADSLMVARIGPLEVAAQGNGGIWAFMPIAFSFGFLTVVNTFVAQHLGAGTAHRSARYAWGSIWLSVIVWVGALLPWAAFQGTLYRMLGHDEPLRALETDYARILIVGAILVLASKGLHHFFFGLHRPKVVAASALAGNGVNLVANYALIFGSDGVPELGLPGVPGVPALGLIGAALGTVLGTLVELAIPALVFLGPKLNAELGTRAAWRPDGRAMRDLLRIGWPAGAQIGNEILCWALFMTGLVGVFGVAHMTAGWAALRYMHLSFMPAVGFSVATTSLVGRYIGAGRPDTAVARARLSLVLSVSYMTACAATFFVFRRDLIGFFVAGSAGPEEAAAIVDIGAKMMICAAIFQTIDAVGIVYTGALRGAGDTVWPGVVTIVYSWLFIIGLGWLLVRAAPGLESLGPWIAAAVYIAVFGVTMAWRFESGRWRSIRLIDPAERDAAEIAPLGPGPPPGTADASVRDIAEEIGREAAEAERREQAAGAGLSRAPEPLE